MWTSTARGGGTGEGAGLPAHKDGPEATTLGSESNVFKSCHHISFSDLQWRPDGRQFYPKELFYVDWCHPSVMSHF